MSNRIFAAGHRSLDSLVNVSPVADVVQVNAALAQTEFVNDSVIAYAQFEFTTAGGRVIRKTIES